MSENERVNVTVLKYYEWDCPDCGYRNRILKVFNNHRIHDRVYCDNCMKSFCYELVKDVQEIDTS